MSKKITSNIFFFENGNSDNKKLLGGKGAGLAKMTQLGLPVPPGFTITTLECIRYLENNKGLPEKLIQDIHSSIISLEEKTGLGFGDSNNPLLVSVRSGSAVSMPGMMDTVLNVGLNDKTVQGLIEQTGDPRFAYDAYRRFIQLFGKVVLHVSDDKFPKIVEEKESTAEELRELAKKLKAICKKETGKEFPVDPYDQLNRTVAAVFDSWNVKRCVDYRREFNIGPEIANGTAVNVVTMVFGNMGKKSGTGVVFTRDPGTGEKTLYGEYLMNAQGEDVVAGIRTPSPVQEMEKELPKSYIELLGLTEKLEKYYKYPQDIEFTIEKQKLYLLQTRNAKMNAIARVRVMVEMEKEGLITKEEALMGITPDTLEQMLHRSIDPMAHIEAKAKGLGASPGASSGIAIFDADTAEAKGKAGEKVILVREETRPEDVHGFFTSQGILTSRGGKTSHAAVVARGIGKPCVSGAAEIKIDITKRQFSIGNHIVKEGEYITIDGTSGEVFLGEIPTIEPDPTPEMEEILKWADSIRKLGVQANADTPENAILARKIGAEGIGLCRTERMFNATDRLPIMVSMILADSDDERRKFLDKLKPMMRQDFKEIFAAMEGNPVTVRLLDIPLHEFLPNIEELHEEIRELKESGSLESDIAEKNRVLNKARELSEVNPMLGHRGVRVGITYPEIYESQIAAICEAAAELIKEGGKPIPKIMIPQVALKQELSKILKLVNREKTKVEQEKNVKLEIKFGTMIEVVRACVTADEIADIAEFFSFGTNDLTQATFSFSREDAENKFLPVFEEKGIINQNPFQTLDKKGVSELMKIAITKGRKIRNDLEVGICGEHGGDPESIEICHNLGITYVSCSPYRIPIARLAAARSMLKTSHK
jgi:pyruvate,orthophosphate dikinase|tara:strand:+ start:1809 stop:4442 length:2634 start_codon:yes stop_codon:yes gene_type:complete